MFVIMYRVFSYIMYKSIKYNDMSEKEKKENWEKSMIRNELTLAIYKLLDDEFKSKEVPNRSLTKKDKLAVLSAIVASNLNKL